MNSIKELLRIYTILSSGWTWPPPVAQLLRGKCELTSLPSYDFYIALLLYSRKWKVRKKQDTRGGRGGRRARRRLGLAPGSSRTSVVVASSIRVRPGSGRYLRFDPEEPRKMISSLSLSLRLAARRSNKNPDSARKRRKREEGQRTMAVTACLMSGRPACLSGSARMLTSQRGWHAGLGFTYKCWLTDDTLVGPCGAALLQGQLYLPLNHPFIP